MGCFGLEFLKFSEFVFYSVLEGDASKALNKLELKLLEDTLENIFKENDEEATQCLYKTLMNKDIPMDVSHIYLRCLAKAVKRNLSRWEENPLCINMYSHRYSLYFVSPIS